MKISITEFLRSSGKYLDLVNDGQEIEITSKRKSYSLKRKEKQVKS